MSKLLFSPSDREFAEAVRRMNASNPFLPERIAAERAALGVDFEEKGSDWNTKPPSPDWTRNHDVLTERCGVVIERLRAAWPRDGRVTRDDALNYEALVGFWLYQS